MTDFDLNPLMGEIGAIDADDYGARIERSTLVEGAYADRVYGFALYINGRLIDYAETKHQYPPNRMRKLAALVNGEPLHIETRGGAR